jgi:hypothetical protein
MSWIAKWGRTATKLYYNRDCSPSAGTTEKADSQGKKHTHVHTRTQTHTHTPAIERQPELPIYLHKIPPDNANAELQKKKAEW